MKLKVRCMGECGKEEIVELPGKGTQSYYFHEFCEEHEQLRIKCTDHHFKKKTIEVIGSGAQTLWTVHAICEDCQNKMMNETEMNDDLALIDTLDSSNFTPDEIKEITNKIAEVRAKKSLKGKIGIPFQK